MQVDQLVLERAYQHEKTLADKPFLTQPYQGGEVAEYSWKQAMHEVRCLAQYLLEKDFPKGSKIAIIGKNTAHWIMSDLAIMMAGHVSVPLYPTLNRKTVSQILEHSEAKLVFFGKLDDPDEIRAGIPEGLALIHHPMSKHQADSDWEQIVSLNKPLQGEPVCDADALATIIYTSGTTGMPKGVMHSHANLAWAGKMLQGILGATREDRFISYLPLSHVAERAGIEMTALQAGLHIFFSVSLETFISDMQRAKPTLFFSVPRLWVKFQQGVSAKLPENKLKWLLRIPFVGGKVKHKVLTQLGLEHVRVAACGAAPTPESTLKWFRSLGLELLEGYGMTETFGLSHLCRPESIRIGFVGDCLPNVDHKLSEQGEVLIKSAGNTQGYFKEPEKTAELFTEDGYIRTGDRGVIDEKGRLRITGRTKELFKTAKGKYVAPAPIENLLTAHDCVEACCVTIGTNQPQSYALLMLSISGKAQMGNASSREECIKTLEAHLHAVNDSLDEHERLAFLVICQDDWTVENGLVTPTFKVKRHLLAEKYDHKADAWYGKRMAVQFE